MPMTQKGTWGLLGTAGSKKVSSVAWQQWRLATFGVVLMGAQPVDQSLSPSMRHSLNHICIQFWGLQYMKHIDKLFSSRGGHQDGQCWSTCPVRRGWETALGAPKIHIVPMDIFCTDGLSSWWARKGDKIRLLVLPVFVCLHVGSVDSKAVSVCVWAVLCW